MELYVTRDGTDRILYSYDSPWMTWFNSTHEINWFLQRQSLKPIEKTPPDVYSKESPALHDAIVDLLTDVDMGNGVVDVTEIPIAGFNLNDEISLINRRLPNSRSEKLETEVATDEGQVNDLIARHKARLGDLPFLEKLQKLNSTKNVMAVLSRYTVDTMNADSHQFVWVYLRYPREPRVLKVWLNLDWGD
jgi:hypothetical protein